MSVEYKKNGNGKCPVMHGSMTAQSTPTHWWPKNLNFEANDFGEAGSGSKAMVHEWEGGEKGTGNQFTMRFRLLPNNVLIGSVKPYGNYAPVNNIRYKCDKNSNEVRQLIASGPSVDNKGWIKVGSRNSIGIFVDTNSKEIITKGSWKWYDNVHSELSENPSRETRFGWIWSSSDKLKPDNYEFKNISEPESIKAAEFDGVKSFVIKSSLFDELIDAPQKYLYIYLKDYDDGSWFSSSAITSSCHKKPCVVIPNPSTPTSTPTTTTTSKLDKAKSACTELGFTLGTEKHGECVLKMMDN